MYTDKQKQVAIFAKVFGHPARVAILQQLFEIEACYCGDLSEEIGLAQPTISQHLKELKTIGLIKGTVEGAKVCYCIDIENWVKMKKVMNQFLDQDIPKVACS
ncbi:MAG: metalloregulator ArsR/SmtB family transcription factor [Gelidibacter sp.]